MSIVGLDPGEGKRWREGREVRRRERVWEGQRRGEIETGVMEREREEGVMLDDCLTVHHIKGGI